ncbi:MAG: VOC family protein [Saprospiraceae bacterium]|nr:VOC family protein [Saprospiraceae bacterium]
MSSSSSSTSILPVVSGLREVIFSVRNLAKASVFYQEVVGYGVLYEGDCSAEQLSAWGLGREASGRETLLGNPGDEEGFIRLVQFDGVEQVVIRSSGQSWDPGGIFDINMRAKNLQGVFEDFQKAGWNGVSDPLRYQFGKFDVSEVLMKGPEDIVIAMMERHAPALEGYPNLKRLSHVFNSSHISKDVETTLDFFVNQLGFKVYMHANSTDRKAGPNVLGFPHNVNAQIELPVYIVHPDGTNFGSLEFLQVKGLEGTDFSERAIPPNLGILMYRFPVSDAMAYAQLIEQRGVNLHTSVTELAIQPYGTVKVFVVKSPEGIWIEFIELPKS